MVFLQVLLCLLIHFVQLVCNVYFVVLKYVGAVLEGFRCVCPVGQYDNGTSCLDCPAGIYLYVYDLNLVGTFGLTSGLTSSVCSGLCPQGTFSLSGSTNCQNCSIGSYSLSLGSTSCVSCPCIFFISFCFYL